MEKLPKDFLWGGAVAAHQLEGGWNKGGDTIIVTVEGGDVDANVQVVKKFLTENL